MVAWAGCCDRARAWAAKPALDWLAVGCSAHTTFRARRAFWARHQLSATTAMPGLRPVRSPSPSTTKAWVTPGMALISSRLALATLAPNTGALV